MNTVKKILSNSLSSGDLVVANCDGKKINCIWVNQYTDVYDILKFDTENGNSRYFYSAKKDIKKRKFAMICKLIKSKF